MLLHLFFRNKARTTPVEGSTSAFQQKGTSFLAGSFQVWIQGPLVDCEIWWLATLGDSESTRSLIAVMQSALGDKTRRNYHPRVREYLQVCTSIDPPLTPLPESSQDTILYYLGALHKKGYVSASSLNVYCSAVTLLGSDRTFISTQQGQCLLRSCVFVLFSYVLFARGDIDTGVHMPTSRLLPK